MVYTKNHADGWAADDLVTTAIMNNFETIYTEASSYLSSHNHDGLYFTKSEMESQFFYAGNDGPGSGADADLIYRSSGNLHIGSFTGLGIPVGLIILWYGALATFPAGWHLCDGTSGTVDLRLRMVVGAGSSYSVGNTGGAYTFTATGSITVNGHSITEAEMAAHYHPFSDRTPNSESLPHKSTPGANNACGALTTTSGNTASAGSGTAHGHTGSSMTGNSVLMIPYFKNVYYIQKIS